MRIDWISRYCQALMDETCLVNKAVFYLCLVKELESLRMADNEYKEKGLYEHMPDLDLKSKIINIENAINKYKDYGHK